MSHRALELILKHPWPGNVRELRNALERALVLARGSDAVEPHHLPGDVRTSLGPRMQSGGAIGTLATMEVGHLQRALLVTRGNRTQAARMLGISRATLHNKIREHGLEEVGRSPEAPVPITAGMSS